MALDLRGGMHISVKTLTGNSVVIDMNSRTRTVRGKEYRGQSDQGDKDKTGTISKSLRSCSNLKH